MESHRCKRMSRLQLFSAIKKSRANPYLSDQLTSVRAFARSNSSARDINSLEEVSSRSVERAVVAEITEEEHHDDPDSDDPEDGSLDESSSSDESEDESSHSGQQGVKPSVFVDAEQNRTGWRISDVCSLILYLAKGSGMSDKTLGKLMSVFALIANTERHHADTGVPFPCSYHRMKSFLKINPTENQKIVYICPATSTGRRKGVVEKVEERCGFRLQKSDSDNKYHCASCKSVWEKKELDKDGNHFVSLPINRLLEKVMSRYGKYTGPLPPALHPDVQPVLNDVTDGLRFREMDLQPTDLAILLHSDGAVMSRSTTKKMYLTFVQCVNIPLNIRLPIWSLQSVWVGDELVKDRECFLIELSRQLRSLQLDDAEHALVKWTDKDAVQQSSKVYVVAYAADAPEKCALNGQLPHSAKQGCPYCLQIAQTINHRICYEFVEDVQLKTHAQVVDQARQWELGSYKTRKTSLDSRSTQGFKRPSVMQHWDKFDMIKGFCLDIMHQFDEGVTSFLLGQLMDKDTILNSFTKASVMDKRFLAISVTGHNNRDVRSLKHHRTFKAHELRFFIQHAAPYVTRGVIENSAYKVFCLASRIAYTCTKDSISASDIADLRSLCSRFMTAFQKTFGVAEMKYSIHLVSHLWYAVELYGPLHIVSCYGPEDQIGKIARKITGMNNTTKHIMNNFVIYSEVSTTLEMLKLEEKETDFRFIDTLRRVQRVGSKLFTMHGKDGTCQMFGPPQMLSKSDVAVFIRHSGLTIKPNQAFSFKRAKTQGGIFVRPERKQKRTRRNESVVMDEEEAVINIVDVIAVVNEEGTEIVGTFIYGMLLTDPEDYGEIPKLGTKSVSVPHIFCVGESSTFVVRRTDQIARQMVVLMKDPKQRTMLVSPPSNRFRPT